MNAFAKLAVGVAVVGGAAWLASKLSKSGVTKIGVAILNAAASSAEAPTTVRYTETKKTAKPTGLGGAMSAVDAEHTEVRVNVNGSSVNVEKREHVAKEANVLDFHKAADKLSKTKGHDDDGYKPLKIN